MGMSASQARLLTITARLTNTEYQAQTIMNNKIRLADESETLNNEYLEALDKKKLVISQYKNGAYVDKDVNYNLLTNYDPEDGLINDDVEKQYTEELDFSNIQEEIDKVKNETIKPVPVEPVYEDAAPVEPLYDDSPKIDSVPVEPVYEEPTNTSYNPGENPSAKVVLNNTVEEEKEEINHKDIKVDLKGN